MGCNCGKRRTATAVTSVQAAAMNREQSIANAIANAKGIADEPEDLSPFTSNDEDGKGDKK